MENYKLICLSGIALAAALTFTIREHVARASCPVLAESGQKLPSLFFGVTRAAWVKDIALGAPKVQSSCADRSADQGFLKKALSMFQLKTVSAQANCQADECAGAYIMEGYNPCGEDCGGGEYVYPLSGGDLPFEGWQYTGSPACPSQCVCQAQVCPVE